MDASKLVKIQTASDLLDQALKEVKEAKPGDRTDRDRFCQIVITDLEKAIAIFKLYVVQGAV